MENKKILIVLSSLLFLIPIIQFLNNNNLPQIVRLDLYTIFFSQFILFIITFFFSYIIYKFFIRKYLDFQIFFLFNSLIAYFFFYFRDLKDLIFNKQNSILDDFLILLIYLLFYLIMFRLKKKITDFLIRFVLIFIVLQFSFFSLSFLNLQIDNTNFSKTEKNNSIFIDMDSIEIDKKNRIIFFLVLDGMMNLDLAEKFKIVENKDELKSKFLNNQLIYSDNFFSNYDLTYLSITSLLKGSYPVIETSQKYSSRKNFFPAFLLNTSKDNIFFQILRKTKKNFYWLGNWWASCEENIYVKCLNSNIWDKFFYILKSFYFNSLYVYIFNHFDKKDNTEQAFKFLKNKENKFTDNSIYLIHVMSPHPPYFFDQSCKVDKNLDQKENYKNYAIAYNCLISLVQEWVAYVNKTNPESLIFILGDHGWSFDEEIMIKNELEKNESRFLPFLSYKISKECLNIKKPNSIVNIMTFALICTGSKDLKYIEDLKFQGFYEDHKKFGEVILKN